MKQVSCIALKILEYTTGYAEAASHAASKTVRDRSVERWLGISRILAARDLFREFRARYMPGLHQNSRGGSEGYFKVEFRREATVEVGKWITAPSAHCHM